MNGISRHSGVAALTSSTVKVLSEVTKDALELTPGQRRTLARILLESSDEGEDFSPDIEAAWEQEIVRRMEAVKTGSAAHSSAEEVFARLDDRFAP